MGSKLIIMLGLFLAVVVLISTEVSARDLTETSNTVEASTEQLVDGRGGYNGGGRKGHGGGGGGCRHGKCCGHHGCRCCSYAGEKSDASVQGEPQN